MPLAGIFSIFLSLGGLIILSNIGEYDLSEPFSYGGFMPIMGVIAGYRRPASPSSPAAGDMQMLDIAEAQGMSLI